MIRAISVLLLVLSAFAQDLNTPRYVVYKSTSLSGAAEVVTLRKSSGNKLATFESAYVYCSVDCTFSLELAGTYSSGATITPNKLASRWESSTMLATSGTSISGTTSIVTYNLTAGTDKVLDLTGVYLVSANDALTIRTNSITGTVQIALKYQEK